MGAGDGGGVVIVFSRNGGILPSTVLQADVANAGVDNVEGGSKAGIAQIGLNGSGVDGAADGANAVNASRRQPQTIEGKVFNAGVEVIAPTIALGVGIATIDQKFQIIFSPG